MTITKLDICRYNLLDCFSNSFECIYQNKPNCGYFLLFYFLSRWSSVMLISGLWGAPSMTDSVALHGFLSRYAFTTLAVCLGLLPCQKKINHLLSRWYCKVVRNLMALFCVHDFIHFGNIPNSTAWTMTEPPHWFTAGSRHSLLYLSADVLRTHCLNWFNFGGKLSSVCVEFMTL